jgi:hypothetical protein
VNKEPNIRVHISLLKIERSQQQMNVVNPNHVLLLLYLDQVLRENVVYLAIGMPHLSILFIYFVFIVTFEIVEEWSQELLIIEHKFLNLIFIEPDRVAVLTLKQILNSDFLILILRNNPWPSNPLEIEKAFFLEPKNGWVEHGPAFLEADTPILLLSYANR